MWVAHWGGGLGPDSTPTPNGKDIWSKRGRERSGVSLTHGTQVSSLSWCPRGAPLVQQEATKLAQGLLQVIQLLVLIPLWRSQWPERLRGPEEL